MKQNFLIVFGLLCLLVIFSSGAHVRDMAAGIEPDVLSELVERWIRYSLYEGHSNVYRKAAQPLGSEWVPPRAPFSQERETSTDREEDDEHYAKLSESHTDDESSDDEQKPTEPDRTLVRDTKKHREEWWKQHGMAYKQAALDPFNRGQCFGGLFGPEPGPGPKWDLKHLISSFLPFHDGEQYNYNTVTYIAQIASLFIGEDIARDGDFKKRKMAADQQNWLGTLRKLDELLDAEWAYKDVQKMAEKIYGDQKAAMATIREHLLPKPRNEEAVELWEDAGFDWRAFEDRMMMAYQNRAVVGPMVQAQARARDVAGPLLHIILYHALLQAMDGGRGAAIKCREGMPRREYLMYWLAVMIRGLKEEYNDRKKEFLEVLKPRCSQDVRVKCLFGEWAKYVAYWDNLLEAVEISGIRTLDSSINLFGIGSILNLAPNIEKPEYSTASAIDGSKKIEELRKPLLGVSDKGKFKINDVGTSKA